MLLMVVVMDDGDGEDGDSDDGGMMERAVIKMTVVLDEGLRVGS